MENSLKRGEYTLEKLEILESYRKLGGEIREIGKTW